MHTCPLVFFIAFSLATPRIHIAQESVLWFWSTQRKLTIQLYPRCRMGFLKTDNQQDENIFCEICVSNRAAPRSCKPIPGAEMVWNWNRNPYSDQSEISVLLMEYVWNICIVNFAILFWRKYCESLLRRIISHNTYDTIPYSQLLGLYDAYLNRPAPVLGDSCTRESSRNRRGSSLNFCNIIFTFCLFVSFFAFFCFFLCALLRFDGSTLQPACLCA